MKIKTAVITTAVIAGICAGAYFGLQHVAKNNRKPVGVVQVSSVNYGDFMYDSDETLYGEIVSRNIQTVELDDEYELTKVYVQQGDTVKRGDALLEYDMTLVELEKEMEELTKQLLEINLSRQQKTLEKLQSGNPDEAFFEGMDDDDLTGAADLFEDNGEPAGAVDPFDDAEAYGGEMSAAEIFDGADAQEDLPVDDGSDDENDGNDSGESQEDDLEVDIEEGDSPSEVISDADDIFIGDDIFDADEVSGDDGQDDASEGASALDADVLRKLIDVIDIFYDRYEFVTSDREKGIDEVSSADIERGLSVYRSDLARVAKETQIVDMLGENRTVRTYAIPDEVVSIIGSDAASALEEAYRYLCFYQFEYTMHVLNPEELDPVKIKALPVSQLLALEPLIRSAVDAYYNMDESMRDSKETAALRAMLEAYAKALYNYYFLVNDEEGEEAFEEETDFLYDDDDFGYDDDEDYGYTAEELKEAIEAQKLEIRSQELEIRESALKIKQFERTLENKVVKSTMDGIVSSAGSVDDMVAEEHFIVITGEAGLYVRSVIRESSLETVKIGDRVTGYSYEYGTPFTAEITEISLYPSDGGDQYYYYDDGFNNDSAYPFYAFIEGADTEGLGEGEVEIKLASKSSGSGIYLENYFIRREPNGKSYVYIRGEDGKLRKQYVKTGSSLYGMALEITSGLKEEDYIAFPYGKDVKNGAETMETDSIDSGDYYY